LAHTKICVSDIAPYLASSEIIDVRSPGEYAEDFIPGAKNHPVLDNDERAHVGTINKQQSPFEAKRFGSFTAGAAASDPALPRTSCAKLVSMPCNLKAATRRFVVA
jgi:rhodanese-related sulfurtransferase